MRRQCYLNFIIKPLQGNSHAKLSTNTKPCSQRAKKLAQMHKLCYGRGFWTKCSQNDGIGKNGLTPTP